MWAVVGLELRELSMQAVAAMPSRAGRLHVRDFGELPSPLDLAKMEQVMAELEEGQRSCVRSCLQCWQVNTPLTWCCAAALLMLGVIGCTCSRVRGGVSLRIFVLSVLSADPALPA